MRLSPVGITIRTSGYNAMSFVTELYKKMDDNANIDYRAPNQKGRRVSYGRRISTGKSLVA